MPCYAIVYYRHMLYAATFTRLYAFDAAPYALMFSSMPPLLFRHDAARHYAAADFADAYFRLSAIHYFVIDSH